MASSHPADRAPEAVVLSPSFPFPPTSGGVKRTLRLLECMLRAGLDVKVVSDDRPDAAAVRALQAHGIATSLLRRPHPESLRRLEQHLRRRPAPRSGELTRALRRAPGLTQIEGIVATAHLGRHSGRPLVFSTQNVEAQIARAAQSRARRLTADGQRRRYHAHRIESHEQQVAGRSDVVLCVSEADAAAFEPYARKIIQAPNGVDAAFFAGANPLPDNEDVVFFGQFTYGPNQEGLLRFLSEGWPRLSQQRPRTRLIIAGQGSTDVDLGKPPSAERIRAVGLVPDIAKTVAASRLSLVPVWSGGGTRLKVLESLAARRPVVGTTLGVSGIGFRSGTHGLIADAPGEMADAATALLDDDPRLEAMADAARKHARAFEWTVALGSVEAMYRDYAVGGWSVSRSRPSRSARRQRWL